MTKPSGILLAQHVSGRELQTGSLTREDRYGKLLAVRIPVGKGDMLREATRRSPGQAHGCQGAFTIKKEHLLAT